MADTLETRITLLVQTVWSLLKETYQEWSTDNAPQLGAALAFYTIFSLAPILIIIMAVVGFFLGKESVQIYLMQELTGFVGLENAKNIMHIVQRSYKPGSGLTATITAISLMLLGSTTIFVTLKNALNTMWGVKYQPAGLVNSIIDRLKSFFTVILVGLVLFLSMLISSVVAMADSFIGMYFPLPVILVQTLNTGLSLLLFTLMFALLFKVLPDVRLSWRAVGVGAGITALLFGLGKNLLGAYLARTSVSSAYGAAGSMVVLLLWVYYSAQIIFIGAEFTQVYARKFGMAIEPRQGVGLEAADKSVSRFL
ncbi:YihY/virulence factor BrkB family protein [Desulfobacca acetoxidans]|uniref:Ribonuclease BN n=1 Tax=Desulfobacca acetoxidans (strain ATCC 700848 / DSM 11109 / ASRB2) TaxID=880072 RepID=F2NGG1_DESAR|nr:YihY/virulence factor BrkB family protein [Desulfobacca acetoxidans]AEB08574.1 ribonuclease BN [Desulfobacca acetoxidans DSM 11109]